jgi:hypothetical protein
METVHETRLETPEERSTALAEILASGRVDIKLANTLTPTLKAESTHIAEGLLVSPWLRPDRRQRNQIPFQGTHSKPVEPTTIEYRDDEGSLTRMRVVVKRSVSPRAAVVEQDSLERLLKETRIRSLLPLAVISFTEDSSFNGRTSAWLITMLETGVIPLERIDYGRLPSNQLKELLNGLAVFTAELGNNGVSHSDFYPRNVGVDISQRKTRLSNRSDFVLFDPESANILDRETLDRMLDVDNNDLNMRERMRFFRIGREYLKDAVDMSEELKKTVDPEVVNREYAEVYVEHRLPMLDLISPAHKLEYVSQGIWL